MDISLNKLTDICVQSGLTIERCYLCLLILEKDANSIVKYTKKFGLFNYKELKWLLDNDYLLSTKGDAEVLEVLDLHVTNKFSRYVKVEEEEAGEEFWEAFPSWMMIGAKKISSKTCNKQDLLKDYVKSINGDRGLHNEIIRITKDWSDRNGGLAVMKIVNYVGSKHWEDLKKESTSSRSERGEEL